MVIAGKRKPIVPAKNIVHLNRWVPDSELHHLIKNCRCVVLPYLVSSQFSGCLALAFHFKKPVLAPFSPAFEKWIEEGKTGWLFSQGDWRDLAEKMRKIDSGELSFSPAAIEKKEKEMEGSPRRGLGKFEGIGKTTLGIEASHLRIPSGWNRPVRVRPLEPGGIEGPDRIKRKPDYCHGFPGAVFRSIGSRKLCPVLEQLNPAVLVFPDFGAA